MFNPTNPQLTSHFLEIVHTYKFINIRTQWAQRAISRNGLPIIIQNINNITLC